MGSLAGWPDARVKPKHLGTRCALGLRPTVARRRLHFPPRAELLGRDTEDRRLKAGLPAVPFSPASRLQLPACLLTTVDFSLDAQHQSSVLVSLTHLLFP